jgi:hypothetical protein
MMRLGHCHQILQMENECAVGVADTSEVITGSSRVRYRGGDAQLGLQSHLAGGELVMPERVNRSTGYATGGLKK